MIQGLRCRKRDADTSSPAVHPGWHVVFVIQAWAAFPAACRLEAARGSKAEARGPGRVALCGLGHIRKTSSLAERVKMSHLRM